MKNKIKTHSGAKKRFKITARGKVKYKKSGLRHLLTGMSSKKGRKLRKLDILAKVSSDAIRKQLPYN